MSCFLLLKSYNFDKLKFTKMKTSLKLFLFLCTFLLINCGGKQEKERPGYGKQKVVVDNTPASKKVDLNNKGVGPIKSISLDAEINEELVTKGAKIYQKMCTACHKVNKKFIGPSPKGILERRSPEWIMNMILNPAEMVKKDPLAKQLLVEFNGSPMANQNLTQEEARAVLEYFRTLN